MRLPLHCRSCQGPVAFRVGDTLELCRLRLPKANDFFVPKPVSLVPRSHVRPVDERMLASNQIKTPIRREDVEERARALLDDGIETLAVLLFPCPPEPRARTPREELDRGGVFGDLRLHLIGGLAAAARVRTLADQRDQRLCRRAHESLFHDAPGSHA
ncbi:MAG: hypothetical protein GDA49_01955 [Rhodospirillales bacterium]|nr:hypothetical protein [Rhodospirillales bacterium]